MNKKKVIELIGNVEKYLLAYEKSGKVSDFSTALQQLHEAEDELSKSDWISVDDELQQRIIKFKAKKLSDDKWVEGYYLQDSKGKSFIYNPILDRKNFILSEVDPSTVCQFTGLKDKNDVEVWEHDIIQNPHTMVRCEVKWNEFICMLSPFGIANSLGGLIKNQGWTVVCSKFDRKEEK